MNIEPFFFIAHLIIGLSAANAAYIQRRAPYNVATYPQWIYSSWGNIALSFTVFSTVAAIITTLVNYNLAYAGLTVIEIFVGAFIVGFLPIRLKLVLALAGPLITTIILGNLWGFWYL